MGDAKAIGVEVSLSPPNEKQIDIDIQILSEEQDKLFNELKKAYEEEADRQQKEQSEQKIKEMEERIKHMNLQLTPAVENELTQLKQVKILKQKSICLLFEYVAIF